MLKVTRTNLHSPCDDRFLLIPQISRQNFNSLVDKHIPHTDEHSGHRHDDHLNPVLLHERGLSGGLRVPVALPPALLAPVLALLEALQLLAGEARLLLLQELGLGVVRGGVWFLVGVILKKIFFKKNKIN